MNAVCSDRKPPTHAHNLLNLDSLVLVYCFAASQCDMNACTCIKVAIKVAKSMQVGKGKNGETCMHMHQGSVKVAKCMRGRDRIWRG